MDSFPADGPHEGGLFDAARHNRAVCLDAARWLCAWLLDAIPEDPPVAQCARVLQRFREALEQVPEDDLASVRLFLSTLGKAAAPSTSTSSQKRLPHT